MTDDPEIRESVRNTQIIVHRGDILELPVECLVCPIDTDLSMHAGLPAVIRDKEGLDLKDRITRASKSLRLSDFVMVDSVHLKAKKIVFVAVFTLSDGQIHKEVVQRAMKRVMLEAEMKSIESLAIPMLGSPLAKAPYHIFSRAMIEELLKYVNNRFNTFKTVYLSLYNRDSYITFRDQLFYLKQQYTR